MTCIVGPGSEYRALLAAAEAQNAGESWLTRQTLPHSAQITLQSSHREVLAIQATALSPHLTHQPGLLLRSGPTPLPLPRCSYKTQHPSPPCDLSYPICLYTQVLPEDLANALVQLLLHFHRLSSPSQLDAFRDCVTALHITPSAGIHLDAEWLAHICSLRCVVPGHQPLAEHSREVAACSPLQCRAHLEAPVKHYAPQCMQHVPTSHTPRVGGVSCAGSCRA